MDIKIKGEKIKEGSVPLNALTIGDRLLKKCVVNQLSLLCKLKVANNYYSIDDSISIVYIVSKYYDYPFELVKGNKINLTNGPSADIIWDNDGIKVTNAYYEVSVYSEIMFPHPDYKINKFLTITSAGTYNFNFEPSHYIIYQNFYMRYDSIELDEEYDIYPSPPLRFRIVEKEGIKKIIVSDMAGLLLNYPIIICKVTTLPDYYISDNIARKEDINVAILQAITTTLNMDV